MSLRKPKLYLWQIEQIEEWLKQNEEAEIRQEGKLEMITNMLKGNEPMEKIVSYSDLTEEEILEIKKDMEN